MINSEVEFNHFALRHYDNPQLVSIEEFESDVKRFTYLNTLLTRYSLDKNDLKEKLIINHIIILSNVFSVSGMLKMLGYKISEHNYKALKTFLFYIGYIDDDEDTDEYLIQCLEKL